MTAILEYINYVHSGEMKAFYQALASIADSASKSLTGCQQYPGPCDPSVYSAEQGKNVVRQRRILASSPGSNAL